MVLYYLSMLDEARRSAAIERIEAYYREQPEAFRLRFEPVMQGLRVAEAGRRLPQHEPGPQGSRVFLGWTTGRHWLLS
jgi:hypothetical protein